MLGDEERMNSGNEYLNHTRGWKANYFNISTLSMLKESCKWPHLGHMNISKQLPLLTWFLVTLLKSPETGLMDKPEEHWMTPQEKNNCSVHRQCLYLVHDCHGRLHYYLLSI